LSGTCTSNCSHAHTLKVASLPIVSCPESGTPASRHPERVVALNAARADKPESLPNTACLIQSHTPPEPPADPKAKGTPAAASMRRVEGDVPKSAITKLLLANNAGTCSATGTSSVTVPRRCPEPGASA